MFTVALQSGLAALKTPQCYKQTSSLHLALTGSVQPSLPDIPTFKPYSANSEKELHSNIEASVPLIIWAFVLPVVISIAPLPNYAVDVRYRCRTPSARFATLRSTLWRSPSPTLTAARAGWSATCPALPSTRTTSL